MPNRTKKAIARATQELLREKPIIKFTVKEITDKCDLTRNSFYYHFSDIYDVVNWIFEDEVESFVEQYVDEQNFDEGILKGIQFLYDNKDMLQHIYRTLQHENVDRYIGRMIDNIIMKLINSMDMDGEYDEETRKVTALFYRSALVGVIQQWLSNDMTTPPEPVAVLCDEVFIGTIKPTLESINKALTSINTKIDF